MLIGAVAAAVGGAFWIAFAVGVTIAAITGLAYAELVTKYPQAAGAALYVNKAFRKPILTFLITICMLSASFAASGSLASGFARYFGQLFALPPPLLVTILFVLDPHRHQLHRHHRVGGGQHDHDDRGGVGPGHRDDDRASSTSSRATPTGAR